MGFLFEFVERDGDLDVSFHSMESRLSQLACSGSWIKDIEGIECAQHNEVDLFALVPHGSQHSQRLKVG